VHVYAHTNTDIRKHAHNTRTLPPHTQVVGGIEEARLEQEAPIIGARAHRPRFAHHGAQCCWGNAQHTLHVGRGLCLLRVRRHFVCMLTTF